VCSGTSSRNGCDGMVGSWGSNVDITAIPP
jgi:hypothetical protein